MVGSIEIIVFDFPCWKGSIRTSSHSRLAESYFDIRQSGGLRFRWVFIITFIDNFTFSILLLHNTKMYIGILVDKGFEMS